MPDRWYAGNAEDERHDYRGWMVGHFIETEESLRTTSDVEIKWGNHAAGEARAEWTQGEQRTTLLILIAGKFRRRPPRREHPPDQARRLRDLGSRTGAFMAG